MAPNKKLIQFHSISRISMNLDLTKEELASAIDLINEGMKARMPPVWLSLLNKANGALTAAQGFEDEDDKSEGADAPA